VALSLGAILSVVQPRWDKLKEKVLPASAGDLEMSEHNTTTKHADSNESHIRSRSALSGSQGGHILPLARLNGKEHESSDAVV
jgi:hypothetical protein